MNKILLLSEPDAGLSAADNLEGLVAILSAFTTDRKEMTDPQVQEWARAYETMLLSRSGVTIYDVFAAASEWVESSRFFPTVSDLIPLLDRRVSERAARESAARAQERAEPIGELPAGDRRFEHVRTADLPPGYDYSQDPHWQRGMDALRTFYESRQVDEHAWIPALAEIDRRRQENGFQGASRPAERACPRCGGARYLRVGGWDAHGVQMGTEGSHYIKCPTCCPQGQYSEEHELAAIRRQRLNLVPEHEPF